MLPNVINNTLKIKLKSTEQTNKTYSTIKHQPFLNPCPTIQGNYQKQSDLGLHVCLDLFV